ncbi:Glucose/arabinose dehydrogenase, beta-propeller fold [Arboricoccus pini]|uniref:Glucose/arabinose dehydrogenase, beta-propeller fold n=1 Tax=Arboricoccus pini TaxID=1963835 RepID=A0A212RFY4_9PROT|nr:sorbosone dehydrogenase family protein [Arboricoccus pini]SNB71281.1 Glucose/arabinose dehydrogenase, beta-propeller fold [Arboricoccus pini]
MGRGTKLMLTGAMVVLAVAGLGIKIVFFPENASLDVAAGTGPSPQLPAPNKTLVPTINIAPAVGWTEGQAPAVAKGLDVRAYARDLDHPRWLFTLPNGDVLVAESNKPKAAEKKPFSLKSWAAGMIMSRAGAGDPSADRITLLRDTDGDGTADQREVFLANLRSPFGMALIGNDFYVANADALMRFSYQPGATRIEGGGIKVVDLPAGINHHWTKNVIVSPDGEHLYVTVGSNSNVGENGIDSEKDRAMIWEIDPSNGSMRPFATGLRNPNGMAFEPETGKLWAAVNERDEIGSDLVPDYVTSVQEGAFYGWPYSYYGQHVDERVSPQRPDLVAKAIAPDYALGPHTASLGIAFAQASSLPQDWRQGLFVAQHGSWNRSPKSGYKVIFVPFVAGKPAGFPKDLLTGFLDAGENARGRPVGVALDGKGALLVADDLGNTIWRVSGAPGS